MLKEVSIKTLGSTKGPCYCEHQYERYTSPQLKCNKNLLLGIKLINTARKGRDKLNLQRGVFSFCDRGQKRYPAIKNFAGAHQKRKALKLAGGKETGTLPVHIMNINNK